MKSIIFSLLVLLTLQTTAEACHRCGCFVTCKKTIIIQPVVHNKVDVKFRHLRLVDQVPEQTQDQINTELALQRQWEMLTSAIPIAPRIDQSQLFRTFQFRANLPPYPGPAQPIVDAGEQRVTHIRRTRILRGQADFSLRIEPGGNVNLIQATQSNGTISSQGTQQPNQAQGY